MRYVFIALLSIFALQADSPPEVASDISPLFGLGLYSAGKAPGVDNPFVESALLYFPRMEAKDKWPVFNIRSFSSAKGFFAISGGTAFRKVNLDTMRIWGVNAYYDFRQGDFQDFHQLGFGIETFGKGGDLRVNGYIPISPFKTNPLQRQKKEIPLKGFDIEIGKGLGPDCHQLEFYGAIGSYFFSSQDEEALGLNGRIQLSWWRIGFLELRVSHDSIFSFRVQGLMGVVIPLEFIFQGNFEKAKQLMQLPFQPIHRREMIVLHNN